MMYLHLPHTPRTMGLLHDALAPFTKKSLQTNNLSGLSCGALRLRRRRLRLDSWGRVLGCPALWLGGDVLESTSTDVKLRRSASRHHLQEVLCAASPGCTVKALDYLRYNTKLVVVVVVNPASAPEVPDPTGGPTSLMEWPQLLPLRDAPIS